MQPLVDKKIASDGGLATIYFVIIISSISMIGGSL